MTPTLYRLVTDAAAPLITLYLARRRRAGREDPERFPERQGIASLARPDGPLVWAHAASVGESLSILPLIGRLRASYPAATFLITTGTVTSARILGERLPAGVIHQYVPVDRLAWVRRFLDHWRPDVALWVESEFWPNLLGEIATRSIPLVLVNARISPSSLKGWGRFPGLIRKLLAGFELCLAQTEGDAARLRALGAGRVEVLGNLKFAADPLPVDEAALAELREEIGGRPCWLAASTHPGEEETIEKAHQILTRRFPDLLTIIVPRHPQRGAEIASALRETGGHVAQRTAAEPVESDTGFYVADTMGELGLFFRLAPIAFMGGSLVPHGGQNMLEAVRLGCAVIHGPHMVNFRDMAAAMAEAGATAEAGDAETIAESVAVLLADEALRGRRAVAGQTVADAEVRALDRVMAALAPILDRVGANAAPSPPLDAADRRHASA